MDLARCVRDSREVLTMTTECIKCPICGNTDSIINAEAQGEYWKCGCCGSVFAERLAKREYEKLIATIDASMGAVVSEAIKQEKRDIFDKLRKDLVGKIKAEYVNSAEVVKVCERILEIKPGDFLADFFKVANSAAVSDVAEYIGEIDEVENAVYMELILDFIIRSLKEAYITPTAALLERCARIFTPAKKQEYYTRFETEVALVKDGNYEVGLSRDVFLAYSSKDMPAVRRILEFIESDEIGLTCFAAFRNLQHGRDAVANYESALKEAIDNCSIFLFVSSVNSRNVNCDAFKKEMAYIRNSEMNKHPECRSYAQLPEKYRKLRIEYRLDNRPTPLVDRNMKEFFAGLTYVEDNDQLVERLGYCMDRLSEGYDESEDNSAAQEKLKAELEEKIKLDYEEKLKAEETKHKEEAESSRKPEKENKLNADKAARVEVGFAAKREYKEKRKAELLASIQDINEAKRIIESKLQHIAKNNTDIKSRLEKNSEKIDALSRKFEIKKAAKEQKNYRRVNYSNGGYYEGELMFGKFNGYGTYKFSDSGDRYEGEWKKGHINGYGNYQHNNGDRYEGEFVRGRRKGLGKYFFNNGDRSESEFNNDRMNGYGIIYYANGDRYEGEHVDDELSGCGIRYYANGDRYEGEFANDHANGYGTLYSANGNRYEGEVHNDIRNGYGTYYSVYGDVYEGSWSNGIRHGYGKYSFANGDIYTGECINDKMTGYGIYQWTDGLRHEGMFEDGGVKGYGILYDVNGDSYEGDWSDSDNAVNVIKSDKNGNKSFGVYVDGKFTPQ